MNARPSLPGAEILADHASLTFETARKWLDMLATESVFLRGMSVRSVLSSFTLGCVFVRSTSEELHCELITWLCK